MNRFLSIIELRAKKTLLPILAAAAVMAAASVIAAGTIFGKALYISDRVFSIPMAAGAVAVFLILAGRRQKKSNLTARLSLLRVSKFGYYWADEIYCTMVFAILWAFEAAALLVYFKIYRDYTPSGAGLAGMYLEIFATRLFRLLIPCEDTTAFLTMLVFCLSMGTAASAARRAHDCGRFPILPSVAIIAYAAALIFSRRIAALGVWTGFCFLCSFMSMNSYGPAEEESEAAENE